jgi:glycosyltransferase involved in cell wall biosynthesis
MKKAFDGFENLTVTSVSPWLMERAKQSPILKDHRHTVVLNGLDSEVFHPYETDELRRELGLTDEKVIFHATPYFSDEKDNFKGGYYVIKLAEALKDKGVRVIVAGDYTAGVRVPDNLTLLGRVSDQRRLAALYSLADVTVIASKKETFSMIIAESLCCGTPTVGFFAGGPETIAIDEYCEFVEYGDVDALVAKTEEMLARSVDNARVTALASDKYSKKNMFSDYYRLYND